MTILRHRIEAHKASNTARLAALALASVRIVDYGGPADRLDPAVLLVEGTTLVFPEEGTHLPNSLSPAAQMLRSAAAFHLLLLDGSWSQARRMLQRIPGLSGLPRIGLAAPPRQRMRTGPAGGLATLEALAYALGQAGEPELTAPLLALFDLAVTRARPAGWPHRPRLLRGRD